MKPMSSRKTGLGNRRHSVLPHLILVPNKNASYRVVMQKLFPLFKTLEPGLLLDAVISLDNDLMKWIMREFPAEKEPI